MAPSHDRTIGLAVLKQAHHDLTEICHWIPRRKDEEPRQHQVRVLNARIAAGEFLVERDDAVVAYWFAVAGVPVDDHRRRQWVGLLAELRQARRTLQRELSREAKPPKLSMTERILSRLAVSA